MFKKAVMCTTALAALASGCMLIGYDTLPEDGQPDTDVDQGDGNAGGNAGSSGDGMVRDASDARDSSMPDAMDAADDDAVADGTISDRSMDSPRQDASESGVDSTYDDAPFDGCQPGETWCDGDKLMVCSDDGIGQIEQDCSYLDTRCAVGVCDDSENQCITQPLSADTRWCVLNTLFGCDGEGSVRTVEFCSLNGDRCNIGVCDSDAGRCKLEPILDETFWCEEDVRYTCDQNGSAIISQNCADLSDACNTGVCLSSENDCAQIPLENDTACFGNGTCDGSGTCVCEPDATWCYEDQLITCGSDGNIAETQDCTLLSGACADGVCNPGGKICIAEPVTDGRACGEGGKCDSEGNCVIGTDVCQSVNDCEITCEPGVSPCILSCEGADACTATCQAGSNCSIDCANAQTCNVVCEQGATCDVSCDLSNISSCLVDCLQGASCLLRCDPLNLECRLNLCLNREECGNGVYSCNASCPN
ncbi:MAG: hypothetical protein JXA30_20840 [Deltaproteobacteria bacterium]|nr:hypothetical protein [Deltaproteobacteria bacterium]